MNARLTHAQRADSFPRAVVARNRWSWAIWLIPAAAVLLCAWFIYHDYVASGPYVTILFPNADGLEEKNTPVRYRGVQVGEVRTITVSTDNRFAVVGVRLEASGRSLAREGSTFWIVRPQVGVTSISGLGTIVSGDYIAVLPGTGPRATRFTGAEKEPVPEAPNALYITLVATSAGSVQEQSPIYYRGIKVGEVLGVRLGTDSRDVQIDARIWNDYTPLIRPESRFWNAGGLNVQVGLFNGIKLNAVSPSAIVGGGIEFATPPEAGAPVTNGMIFPLNDKADDKWKTWNPLIPLARTGETPNTNVVSADGDGTKGNNRH